MMDMPVRTIPLAKGYVALVDQADWERPLKCGFKDGFEWSGRLCDMRWFRFVNHPNEYCLAFIGNTRRKLRMHRAIMCATADQLVDHRDRNGLNNQRSNLRFATYFQNAGNRSGNLRNRSSRFKGVYGGWTAQIAKNRKNVYLGRFATEEEAARAYDAAAREYFGEFACLNFPAEATP